MIKSETLRYKEGGGVEVVGIEVPDPGPKEVQVRGTVCGICAWDLYTFKQGSNAPYAAPPGHEGVGYVSKVGSDVEGVKEGDRVVGVGFTRDYNMDAAELHFIPDDDTPDEHWIVEPVSCIVTGLDRSEVRAGDRVALIGCGFMGLIFLQGLARSPIAELTAIDIQQDRLALAKSLGATETLNPKADDFEERLEAIKAREIDLVVDCTGVQQGIDTATRLIKRGGRIVLFGWDHGRASFDGDAWHTGGYTVVNASPSARVREVFEPAIRMMSAGLIDLEPLVTHVVPLEEAGELMKQVTEGEAPDYIKGVITL